MSSAHPAYHIHLSNQQKRLIAEISAMQSQIEWLMRLTVQDLLGVSPELARDIVGSTSLDANARIWIKTIRAKMPTHESVDWAEWAHKKLPDITAKRNNFLHTLYGHDSAGQPQGSVSFIVGRPSARAKQLIKQAAVKVKNTQPVDLSQLTAFHREIAFVTKVFAHINWTMTHPSEPSPWRRTLAVASRTYLQSAKSHSTTRQQAPPKSSRR